MAHPSFDAKRRRFCTGCASAGLLTGGMPRLIRAATEPFRELPHTTLVRAGPHAKPLRPEGLEPQRNYIFPYPFVGTPCFLLDLGEPVTQSVELQTREGRSYRWSGGVGPNRSLVAYSAICSHRMTYPAPSVSFISYRSGSDGSTGVIHCCSENSVYDPRNGARVLGGPAPEPLAAIALEYDEQHRELRAVGAYGGTLFNRFLDSFANRLSLEYGGASYRQRVERTTPVYTLAEYSDVQMRCS